MELTVRDRAGIARIHFPPGQRLAHSRKGHQRQYGCARSDSSARWPRARWDKIRVIGNDAVSGSTTAGGFCGTNSRYTLYFAARFEQPFHSFATWKDETIQKDQREAAGQHTGAWLDFGEESQVQLKVGISYVSEANALANLNQELPAGISIRCAPPPGPHGAAYSIAFRSKAALRTSGKSSIPLSIT